MSDVELVVDPAELPSSANVDITTTAKGKPKVTLSITHLHGETKVAYDPRNAIKIGRALVVAGQEAVRGGIVLPSDVADEVPAALRK